MAENKSGQEQLHDSDNLKNDVRVIPASELETLPKKLSVGQKVIIALGIVFLIAIGFSFQGAEKRENLAAQEIFSKPMERIIRDVSAQTGIAHQFGLPAFKLSAGTQNAQAILEFAKGQLNQSQAASLGVGVCGALARAYVDKGYMPTQIRVFVNGANGSYGQAVFNGDFDTLGWLPAQQ